MFDQVKRIRARARIWGLIFLLLSLSACQRDYLRVRTEIINESYHAANQIEVPNLCVAPFCGQQLVISYRHVTLPATLVLSIRDCNQQVMTISREVTTSRGYWLYRSGPLLGYKVELYHGNACLATFSHLWADSIAIQ